ncbi:hypothetical protein CGSSpBS455_07845 [Streptococcus pneumoniae BS455]|nr:hypothetical protein CGSSpBS455_07845 [Streptococcus pneumoniae BS455]
MSLIFVVIYKVKEAGQKSLQNRKKAAYRVFKNLDRMSFIMESLIGFSPQIEFLISFMR